MIAMLAYQVVSESQHFHLLPTALPSSVFALCMDLFLRDWEHSIISWYARKNVLLGMGVFSPGCRPQVLLGSILSLEDRKAALVTACNA